MQQQQLLNESLPIDMGYLDHLNTVLKNMDTNSNELPQINKQAIPPGHFFAPLPHGAGS